jgi:hypothetical protein
MANLFDPDYLMEHELVFIGSPETVARKIHGAAQSGLFNALDPPIWRKGNSSLARVRTVLMPSDPPPS